MINAPGRCTRILPASSGIRAIYCRKTPLVLKGASQTTLACRPVLRYGISRSSELIRPPSFWKRLSSSPLRSAAAFLIAANQQFPASIANFFGEVFCVSQNKVQPWLVTRDLAPGRGWGRVGTEPSRVFSHRPACADQTLKPSRSEGSPNLLRPMVTTTAGMRNIGTFEESVCNETA